jgi:UDP-glucose 4-epimerase
MRIFVTGATGYIGGPVSRALRRAGHEVSDGGFVDEASLFFEAWKARRAT